MNTRRPAALRSDKPQHISQNREYGEDPVTGNGHRRMPFRVLSRMRNEWLESKFPVPQAAMMRADISHDVYRTHPGMQDRVRYPVLTRDASLDLGFHSGE